MYQDLTAKAFYLQLRHLLEDESATAFDAQEIGRAVILAIDQVRLAVAPLNSVPNLHKYSEETPGSISADIRDQIGDISDAGIITLPEDFNHFIGLNHDGIPFSMLDQYDSWTMGRARVSAPVACRINNFILLAPTNIGDVYLHYVRSPYRSFKEGSGAFTAHALAVTGQVIDQWNDGLIWKKGTTWTDTGYWEITNNTATSIEFSETADVETDYYRLFQTPDISRDLLPAVLYKTAMILDGGDPEGGEWTNSYNKCIEAFTESGGDK